MAIVFSVGAREAWLAVPIEYISVFFALNSKITAKKGLNRLIDGSGEFLKSQIGVDKPRSPWDVAMAKQVT
ncbi:hypothetical protein [Herbaspirillum hiltneri]|uniref:hypothetical protein n=1 Tax=Herbaspirillum hiltneri TaxID=341045 RepID=UPI0011875694|nr:hypothetical protein [Herbaspirillum hiltneri]